VATETEIEQLFASLALRLDEIRKRDAPQRTGGNVGCLLMALPFAAAVGVLPLLKDPDIAEMLWGWPLVVAPVIGVVSFLVGRKLQRPWGDVSAEQSVEATDVARQPLAALLLPGATFSFGPIGFTSYHPSLLMVRGAGASHAARIEGRMLGLPIRIDELGLDFDAARPAHWMAEVELPFVLDGHLRIHRRTMMTPGAGLFWNDGFDRLEDESRRLGSGWKVEQAPLGVGTDEGVGTAPPGAIPPTVLLTEGLFAVLRDRQDIWIAATARRLWIFVERSIMAFESSVPSQGDVPRWKRAAVAMQDVEAVTREVLAAAGVRS
jgi:hypothetical protein